jgi:hypothetical protein
MTDFTASACRDRIAPIYDEWYADLDFTTGHPDVAIEELARFAGSGPALELGAGTGIQGLPLSRRNIAVSAIEWSVVMANRMRAKPGGTRVTLIDPVSLGTVHRFSLVFAVRNALFWLQSQTEQVAFFGRAASLLNEDGRLLVEAEVPDLGCFDRGQSLATRRVDSDRVILLAATHDLPAQRWDCQHIEILKDGIRLYPARLRYAWPAEMDAMAELAGLKLVERWADFRRTPMSRMAGGHVSVYARAG